MEDTPVSEMFVTLDSGINDSYSLDPSVSQTDNSSVWIFTIMTMVVIFAIVSGNTLVCIAVATDRSLKAVQNRFLVSLAISDLTVGIVIMPMGLVNQLLGYWMFGVVLCQLWKVCDVLACTASIWNLCLIAIDRYCCITRAVKYTAWRTSHRVNMMIVFVWALAIFISVPPLFGWRVEDSPSGRFKCLISEDVAYILFSTMGSFYIPAVIMIVTYAKVWRAAKVRARSNSNVRDYEIKTVGSKPFSPDSNCHSQNYGNTGKRLSEVTSKKSQVDFKNAYQDNQLPPHLSDYEENQIKGQNQFTDQEKKIESFHEVNHSLLLEQPTRRSTDSSSVDRSKRRLAQRRERRATLVLGIIMGTFLACWYPFFQLYVISALCGMSCNIPNLLFDIIFWIGYCNSALNPIIYTVFNRDFRNAFAKIISKTCYLFRS